MKKLLLTILILSQFVISNAEDKYWATPTVDTYIYATAKGTSYYSETLLPVHDVFADADYRSIIYFADIIDSISGASSIDSACLSLHYSFGAAGSAETRVFRMITDGSWWQSAPADSKFCCWDYRYNSGSTINWAAGQGDHSSTRTTDNSVLRALVDTVDTGYLEFDITNIISDIKTAGVDYGFWLEAEYLDRVYWDSADDAGGDYPTLYIKYTVVAPGGGQVIIVR